MAIISIKMLMPFPNKPNVYLHKIEKKIFRPISSAAANSLNKPCTCSFKRTPEPNYDQTPITRRSGNYRPPLWDFDYIQSLKSHYSEERHSMRASVLKKDLNMMLEGAIEQVDQLEFIDDLQRLGISYHFEDIIKQILTRIHEQNYNLKNKVQLMERDLYTTSLEFRLLRRHGFKVSQEIFDCFRNEKGEFKPSLRDDTKGLLQLYEASHLLMEGEITMEMAREFATISLAKNIEQNESLVVRSALELPLHWRVQRPNARWLIHEYEKKPDMNPVLLEFAKLDFNIVQAIHQEELKHVSRWWNRTCLAEKLPFARDCLVESYLWAIGGLFEPQYGYLRIMSTKVAAFITIIDDIYDVYGTLEELQLFTNLIQRWDIEDTDQLPDYMQICFLALNNFINEMAYDVLKDQGLVIIPYLRKSWTDLCEVYLQEAKWYSEGYKPSMEEYINSAWISVSAHVYLSHAFFAVTNPIEKKAIQCLYKYHDIIRWSGMILRFANDLVTSPDEMEKGDDVPKSIQCYMNETGADEKEAEEYVRFLLSETWKKMNKERIEDQSVFSPNFIRSAVDLSRMAHYMYHKGHGHGTQNHVDIKNRISSLLFEPIAIV